MTRNVDADSLYGNQEMKGGIGKSQSYSMYPMEWDRDLQDHPLEIEGAWIRICNKLWWSKTKGKLARTVEQWSRVLRVDLDKTASILAYLKAEHIATVYGVPKNGASQVTVISRRMVRDENIRKIRSRSGKLGGNPSLKKTRDYGTLASLDKQNSTTRDNQNPTTPPESASQVPASDKDNKYKKNSFIKNKNILFMEDSEEIRLASLLLCKILERKPSFKKPDLQTWAKHIDLAIRVDQRTPERIEELILWVQADLFWQNNILSTEKLREKFDQLELKMLADRKKGGDGNGIRTGRKGFDLPSAYPNDLGEFAGDEPGQEDMPEMRKDGSSGGD